MTHWYGAVGSGPGEPSRTAHWLFTSRRGGVSRAPFDSWNLAAHVGDDTRSVKANRTLLAELAGVTPSSVVYMRQCHSADVRIVERDHGPEVQEVDGLVTSRSGLVMVALAADCVPVALVDPLAGVVAAVHAGWQGMVKDVIGSALERMVELGAETARIRAALGPAICGGCYPVPPERAEQAAAAWPASAAVSSDGQPAIDVRAGLVQRLQSAGVLVELVGGCTAEDPEMFSYRRDDLTGRQGVAVWWTEQ